MTNRISNIYSSQSGRYLTDQGNRKFKSRILLKKKLQGFEKMLGRQRSKNMSYPVPTYEMLVLSLFKMNATRILLLSIIVNFSLANLLTTQDRFNLLFLCYYLGKNCISLTLHARRRNNFVEVF